jgi:hypothetical protein
LNYMAQRNFRASAARGENVPSYRPLSVPDKAATALDLVCQAADVFRTIEEHAHETEARAQSLSEKLRLAEMRAELSERAQRELIIATDHKLQEASRALEHAQSRIKAQEDQLTAVEFRAQAAEAEARETKQALALVEDAIRRRLLSLTPGPDSSLTAAAWSELALLPYTREIIQGKRVLIPIWLDVTKEEVYEYSPILLDAVGIKADLGIDEVARKLFNVLTDPEQSTAS